MADAKSTRAPARTRSKPRHARKPAGPRPAATPPDLEAPMEHLSAVISLVTTATRAIIGVQERNGGVGAADLGDEILTLERGVASLRQAHDALEVLLRSVVR
ncbi:MAG: hypothetical protein ABI885_17425 [Gammaproteobacteria bacterium]